MAVKTFHFLILLFFIFLFKTNAVAQQTTDRCDPRETIWKKNKKAVYQTFTNDDFRRQYKDSASIATIGCDSLPTFVLLRAPSPWRLGLNAGPNIAYCGSWDNTFGSPQRDNSLYNGYGVHLGASADYFLSRPERRLRFGLGGAFGYQNYFTREAYKDDLIRRAVQGGVPEGRVAIRNRPSEDFYWLLGPVLSWTFNRSRRDLSCASFLEASVKGGLWRTEAAVVAAHRIPDNRLVRMVAPSDRVWKPGGLGSLGVFFPLRNGWHWGVQGNVFYTRVDYFIVDGLDDVLLTYSRRHGGFNGNLALRKSFTQKKLQPVRTEVRCDSCRTVPTIRLSYNGQSLAGRALRADSLPENFAPAMNWSAPRGDNRTYEYRAQLYYQPLDSTGARNEGVPPQPIQYFDSFRSDTTLTFPASFGLRPGAYFLTVQMKQNGRCGWIPCGVATESFAITPLCEDKPPVPCEFQHELSRVIARYYLPYSKKVKEICYCEDTPRETGRTLTRRYRNYETLVRNLNPALTFRTQNSTIQLPQDEGHARLVSELNKIREQIRREGGRLVSLTADYRIEELPCPGKTTLTPPVTYRVEIQGTSNLKAGIIRETPPVVTKTPVKKARRKK